ncbi:MAG: alpha/beta fold hydrolase [Candidatus Competibacteraceae bacterium]
MRLEIISRRPAGSPKAVPLLFVHGAFVGAAVWDAHFLAYFAEHGYSAHAVSLRGHGGSAGHESLSWHSLADYVDDLRRTVAVLDAPPVLIGHSMGGMVVQKYLEMHAVPGLVLMASVPPHGSLSALWGLWASKPLLLGQLALLQQFGPRFANLSLMRELLFSQDTPTADIVHYFPCSMENRTGPRWMR